MATNNKLKAYVRFDGSGRIISSSLILQRNKPKVGNWREINSKECCDNACLAPKLSIDFRVVDSISASGGVLLFFNTSPGFVLQAQLVQDVNLDMCQTGEGAGPIYTVPEGSVNYAIFFPSPQFDDSCNIQFRHMCNPDFHSEWITYEG